MNLSTITMLSISIFLLGMSLASASTSEIPGGMEVVAGNGGAIFGVSTPTSTSLCLGESTFTRDFTNGETQKFAALFANDDKTLGMVNAARSSKPNSRDPTKSYALLPFRAPDSQMNIQLLQNTRPGTIDSDEFTTSIQTAANTWTQAGAGYERTFFGGVTDAPVNTPATQDDTLFVHSFQQSSGSWLAGNWLSWDNNGVLTDSDVVYNTRYYFDTARDTDTTYGYDRKNPVQIADLTAIALHELGHNVGLDDIYNKPQLKWDMSEVMNAYVWGQPRFSLGEGDKAGLEAKYG